MFGSIEFAASQYGQQDEYPNYIPEVQQAFADNLPGLIGLELLGQPVWEFQLAAVLPGIYGLCLFGQPIWIQYNSAFWVKADYLPGEYGLCLFGQPIWIHKAFREKVFSCNARIINPNNLSNHSRFTIEGMSRIVRGSRYFT